MSHDPRNYDLSRILKYAPAELIGREAELARLNAAWANPREHILTLVALGGEGKTSLVAKWATELAAQDWPGCDSAFAWSFYNQGTREQLAPSSDLFLKEALTFFGDEKMANSAEHASEKGKKLARLVGQRRSLLILDGLEPLQYAPTSPTPGELKDQGLAALLKGLAAASHGLCVVTTRYSLPDLKAFWQTTAPEVKLLRLSRDAGVHLLQQLGVRKESGSKADFENLVEDVKGHALTLTLLGTYLRDAHAGDIRKRDLVKLEEANAEEQNGHAFRVMAAYEKTFESGDEKSKRALSILRLMGLFDRPMTADCFDALRKAPVILGLTDPLFTSERKWLGFKQEHLPIETSQLNIALTRLEDARLLTINRDAGIFVSFDAHPLLREYFARQLRAHQPDAWRAAHRRLYEHLCASTPDKPQPTLEDLQPLYQAVAHGCQAGLQQEAFNEVYLPKILRGASGPNSFYNVNKLGGFGDNLGGLTCFYEKPWSVVHSGFASGLQGWLLAETAFSLRALGRLGEALEPMRVGLQLGVEKEEWKNSAIRASNLSELELTLGEVAGAVGDAEQSVTYADRSGDAFLRMVNRTTHADALHQAGRRAEAETRFREAEQMQQEMQPDYPLLYSLPGFRYCDLLLAAPERAAFGRGKGEEGRMKEEWVKTCQEVKKRAATALDIVLNGSRNLLDIALNHLTLGRAALYEAILTHSTFSVQHSELFHIGTAVSGLRDSGLQTHLPLGLLTRAWLRVLTGACTGPDSAQEDLDAAWEIAERGPMKLFMADIHLYRARLFFREKEYPWNKNSDGSPRGPKDDLAAARALIQKCGYWRRKEELEDAEQAMSS